MQPLGGQHLTVPPHQVCATGTSLALDNRALGSSQRAHLQNDHNEPTFTAGALFVLIADGIQDTRSDRENSGVSRSKVVCTVI